MNQKIALDIKNTHLEFSTLSTKEMYVNDWNDDGSRNHRNITMDLSIDHFKYTFLNKSNLFMSKFSYKTIAINTYQDCMIYCLIVLFLVENCVLYMFKQYSNVTNILISYFQILGYVVKYKKALVLDYILSHVYDDIVDYYQ